MDGRGQAGRDGGTAGAISGRAARARARLWPSPAAAGARLGLPGLGTLWGGLAGALAQEVEGRRGFTFVPVGFGVGIGLYFAAEREPWLLAGLVLAALLAGAAFLARERPGLFHMLALLAAVAAGFGGATLQVARMAHPVLPRAYEMVGVSGFVERSERRPKGGRIVLRVTALERADVWPERVRIALTGAAPPPVGAHVLLRASLAPPGGPAYPGGYDFGRDAWFDGIGATGFSVGRVEVTPAPEPPDLALRLRVAVDGVRQAMDARIHAALPGSTGAIATALVTGTRDAVPASVEEAMRISGIYHVLSISGLHMAMVVWVLFVASRALLASVPGLALRAPIKAWAAVPAIAGASFYLLLSGAEVATQRSYLMAVLVLAGVMLGRPAVTLRTLALAALVVLALSPAALLDPGTQMSFAATLALVAGHERFAGIIHRFGGTHPAGRALRWVVAILVSSLVAALATAPYAAFHFHRVAPLSLIANLGTAPVISFVIMPAGLLGALLIPFGLDAWAFAVMGWGIKVMVAVAAWVAAIPGADGGLPAFSGLGLVLMTLGLIVLCVMRSRLLLAGPALIVAGLATAMVERPPDIFIDADGATVGVRGPDGHLARVGDRPAATLENRFAVAQWRASLGERPVPGPEKPAPPVRGEAAVSSRMPRAETDGTPADALGREGLDAAGTAMRAGESALGRRATSAMGIAAKDIATTNASTTGDSIKGLSLVASVPPGPGGRTSTKVAPSAAATTTYAPVAVTPATAVCDMLGCALPLPQGGMVAYPLRREALIDDCRLARIIVTSFTPPPDCAATVIATEKGSRQGALAVWVKAPSATMRQTGAIAAAQSATSTLGEPPRTPSRATATFPGMASDQAKQVEPRSAGEARDNESAGADVETSVGTSIIEKRVIDQSSVVRGGRQPSTLPARPAVPDAPTGPADGPENVAPAETPMPTTTLRIVAARPASYQRPWLPLPPIQMETPVATNSADGVDPLTEP